VLGNMPADSGLLWPECQEGEHAAWSGPGHSFRVDAFQARPEGRIYAGQRPIRMNPLPQKPLPRFLESTAFRRRSAMKDAWGTRGLSLAVGGVGCATACVFLFLVLFLLLEAGFLPWQGPVRKISEGSVPPGHGLRMLLGPESRFPESDSSPRIQPRPGQQAPAVVEPRETPADGPRFRSGALWWGSLKVTAIALLVAVPLALTAALYVSQAASRRRRAWLKPTLAAFAGVPTVALGFFALTVLAPLFQATFGAPMALHGVVAGIAVGLAILPGIFSIAEDALGAVPGAWVRSAVALGATRWEAVRTVVMPVAAPGIAAAVLLGMVQALGEIVIVMMVSGQGYGAGPGPGDPVLTVPVAWALEWGGPHHREAFRQGAWLLLLSLGLRGVARLLRRRHAALRREERP